MKGSTGNNKYHRRTPRRKYRRCRETGKVRFQDKITAMLALAKAKSPSASARRDEVRCYRCPFCKSWHLTSKKAR